MPRITPDAAGSLNRCAFLDTLAFAEIGPDMLADSDDGYDVLVGSLPGRINTFDSYADHPLIGKPPLEYRDGLKSSAAGRYQILSRYWRHYERQLGLPDFGPVSQDRYALQQMREQRALGLIDAGRFIEAVDRCRNIWASLPGAGYNQREHHMADLIVAYRVAGGTLHDDDLHWFDEAQLKPRA